jgi:hypothetical protein
MLKKLNQKQKKKTSWLLLNIPAEIYLIIFSFSQNVHTITNFSKICIKVYAMIQIKKLCDKKHVGSFAQIGRLVNMAEKFRCAFEFEPLIKLFFIKQFISDVEKENNPHYENRVLNCFRLKDSTQNLHNMEFCSRKLDIIGSLNEINFSYDYSFSNYSIFSSIESFIFDSNNNNNSDESNNKNQEKILKSNLIEKINKHINNNKKLCESMGWYLEINEYCEEMSNIINLFNEKKISKRIGHSIVFISFNTHKKITLLELLKTYILITKISIYFKRTKTPNELTGKKVYVKNVLQAFKYQNLPKFITSLKKYKKIYTIIKSMKKSFDFELNITLNIIMVSMVYQYMFKVYKESIFCKNYIDTRIGEMKRTFNYKEKKNIRNIIINKMLDFISEMQDLFKMKRMFLDRIDLFSLENTNNECIDKNLIASYAVQEIYNDNNYKSNMECNNSIFKFVKKNVIIKNVKLPIIFKNESIVSIYLKSYNWIFNYLNLNIVTKKSNELKFNINVYHHNLLDKSEEDKQIENTFKISKKFNTFKYKSEIDKILENGSKFSNKQVMELSTLLEHLKLTRFFSKYKTEEEKYLIISNEINNFLKIQKQNYKNDEANIPMNLFSILGNRKIFLFGFQNYEFSCDKYLILAIHKIFFNKKSMTEKNEMCNKKNENVEDILCKNLKDNNDRNVNHLLLKWMKNLDFDKKQVKFACKIIIEQKLNPTYFLMKGKKFNALVSLNIIENPISFLDLIGNNLENVCLWIEQMLRIYKFIEKNRILKKFIKNQMMTIYEKDIQNLIKSLKNKHNNLKNSNSILYKNIKNNELRLEIFQTIGKFGKFLDSHLKNMKHKQQY